MKRINANPFKDVRVRKTLYYGINEALIIKRVMSGFAQPAGQFYPVPVNGNDPSVTRPAYDLEKAKALLAQAGFKNGFTVVLDSPYDRYINDERGYGAYNGGRYANPEVDQLIEDSAMIFDKKNGVMSPRADTYIYFYDMAFSE